MAMGTRRKRERQQDLWIASKDVVETPANAFYDRLNRILDEHKFDTKVERLLRKFLGYALDEATPDHSTISRTRRLYWLETHTAIFRWVLKVLDEEGLVSGRTVSIDATTLEANAALKSIVRRDNGQSYNDYLKELAKAAGMENPTREQLARLDRKR